MTETTPSARAAFLVVLALALWAPADRAAAMQVLIVREARAQAEPAAPADADPLVIDDEAAAAAVQPAQPAFILNDNQFDQWVFGSSPGAGGGRNRLDALLSLQVEDAARVCRLTEVQKKKLRLAGSGDIKRFFEKVDEKRKKFEKVKTDQNKIGEIYQELSPLRSLIQSGLFDEGSFFSKTLRTILTDDEVEAYEERLQRRNSFRYRAKIELVVAQLDQSVGFRSEQRKKLIDLILTETDAPERYGQYDYYLVLYQAARIPADKLRPLFDDRQWALLQRLLNQGRGMDQFLRAQGLLPEKEKRLRPAGLAKGTRRADQNAGALPANVFAPAGDVE